MLQELAKVEESLVMLQLCKGMEILPGLNGEALDFSPVEAAGVFVLTVSATLYACPRRSCARASIGYLFAAHVFWQGISSPSRFLIVLVEVVKRPRGETMSIANYCSC